MPRAACTSVVLFGLLAISVIAAEPNREALRFFEQRVRPVLVETCYDCHSGKDAESGLHLDSLAGMLRGGTRGPAIVLGKPEKSLIVRALRHDGKLQMPPKEKISTKAIADIATWIKMGAPWPNAKPVTAKTPAGKRVEFTVEEKRFWAFQPPRETKPPAVRNRHWVRSPTDAFLLARLEARGLTPAPPADKRTLIRRATFDLIGLPPTPAEVEAFVADDSPVAFAKVVDRLLASPRYGERWGRHWLDVARYGDSNGLDENLAFANAFRYRDYVVAAFNSDKPYDRFIHEQLAGDLLPAIADAEVMAERITATGFLSLGAKMLAEDDPVKMEMDIIDEQVDTVGRAFLGLTLGCARCHDHKFDPIPTAGYYSLAGIFKSTKTMDHFKVVARWQERPLGAEEAIRRQQAHRDQIAAKEAELKRLKKDKADKKRLDAVTKELDALKKSLPKLPEAMAVSEGDVQNLKVHIRGSHLTLGPEVPRRFPRILGGEQLPTIDSGRSGRLELARWLTEPGHPLTARVMVNRIWQGHFGAGLVRSPDNFGRLGERPTHPELLDWLAVRFVRSGWSIKAMHRTIMLSAAYHMSTAWNRKAVMADPENRLWWRMDRRRLEAEAIRDGLLAVAGQLDGTMGGSLLPTPNRAYVTSTANVNPAIYNTSRRSIYLPIVRSALYEVLQAFDFPDPSVLTAKRQATTVAPQALFMMNSEFVAEQTRAMARALLSEKQLDDNGRLNLAYQRAYGRSPSERETNRDLQYIKRYTDALASREPDPDERRLRAWQSLCRAIIAANEFVYVE